MSEKIEEQYREMMRLKNKEDLNSRLAHEVRIASSRQLMFGKRYSTINNGESFYLLPDIIKGQEKLSLRNRIRFESMYTQSNKQVMEYLRTKGAVSLDDGSLI